MKPLVKKCTKNLLKPSLFHHTRALVTAVLQCLCRALYRHYVTKKQQIKQRTIRLATKQTLYWQVNGGNASFH